LSTSCSNSYVRS